MASSAPVVFFPPSYIAEVGRATDNDRALTRALEKRDVEEAKRRFTFQLMERPHHDNARRLLRIRKLYDTFKQLCEHTA